MAVHAPVDGGFSFHGYRIMFLTTAFSLHYIPSSWRQTVQLMTWTAQF